MHISRIADTKFTYILQYKMVMFKSVISMHLMHAGPSLEVYVGIKLKPEPNQYMCPLHLFQWVKLVKPD